MVKRLAAILGIETPIHVASGLGSFPEDPDERLIALTKHFGADTYLAGNGGHEYMDLEKYERAGVEVLFQDYRHPALRSALRGIRSQHVRHRPDLQPRG